MLRDIEGHQFAEAVDGKLKPRMQLTGAVQPTFVGRLSVKQEKLGVTAACAELVLDLLEATGITLKRHAYDYVAHTAGCCAVLLAVLMHCMQTQRVASAFAAQVQYCRMLVCR